MKKKYNILKVWENLRDNFKKNGCLSKNLIRKIDKRIEYLKKNKEVI